MLKINRVHHIAQVVPDVAPQVTFLEGVFGFQRRQEREHAKQSYHGVSMAVPGTTGVGWEVLAPQSDISPLAPYIERPRGPGLHHIAIEVPDVAAALGELEQLGIEPVERGEGWFDAQIDPARPPQGLLFRFFSQAAPEPCIGTGGVEPAAEGDDGSLGIIAVDHICHAYRDRDELARFYQQALGFREIYRTPDGEHDDLADLVMDIPGTQLKWEIIQPVGEESFIEKFLSTRGPSPHHVTFEVGDWNRAVAASEQHEIPIFDENQGETDGARWRDAFIHPRHTGGMLVQVFWEEKPGVWVRSDKIPSNR